MKPGLTTANGQSDINTPRDPDEPGSMTPIHPMAQSRGPALNNPDGGAPPLRENH